LDTDASVWTRKWGAYGLGKRGAAFQHALKLVLKLATIYVLRYYPPGAA